MELDFLSFNRPPQDAVWIACGINSLIGVGRLRYNSLNSVKIEDIIVKLNEISLPHFEPDDINAIGIIFQGIVEDQCGNNPDLINEILRRSKINYDHYLENGKLL